MKILGKLLDYLEEGLIVIGLAFMTVMNFVNVVSRYLFTNSFSFTEELTVLAFVWISMLGVATGFKRYAHLGMSYFVDFFPRRGRAFMALFASFCSLVMIVIMIQEGAIMVQGQIDLDAKTPALGMPVMWQGLAIPVGGVFIALRILQSGWKKFWDIWSGQAPLDEMSIEARALAGLGDALGAATTAGEGRDR
ncbi:MAG: TRAP transporter small permease [Planctomycetes bacterium]|nr:TRAP transporter small permease [Planctomycetota bacterium]